MNERLNDLISNRQQELYLISHLHVLIVGIGGIGSWVAFNLALSGKVQSLTLVDPDIVEETNLNRTPFRICDIGKLKVHALKYLILERRTLKINTYAQKTQDIKESLIRSGDIIIDCRDNIYDDLYKEQFYKYYKIGYDGLSITIDSQPHKTKVMNFLNQAGYRTIPSFIVPTQLASLLVINEILVDNILEGFITFNTSDIMKSLLAYQYQQKQKKESV